MVAEPGALLHLRPAVRDVRRGSCLHLPVGGAARYPRGLRPARDGGVHRHSRPGPCLRMAEAGVAVGLVEKGWAPKPLSALLNTARHYSLWVYQWGLACCAIEMGAAFGSPRYDVMRLGVIPFPASARQAGPVAVRGTG